jgi:hypothetical protein
MTTPFSNNIVRCRFRGVGRVEDIGKVTLNRQGKMRGGQWVFHSNKLIEIAHIDSVQGALQRSNARNSS